METFNKFLEKVNNSNHSFIDLLNLSKEVSNYIYNKDVIKSGKFKLFKETENGFELIFDKSDKDDIFINTKKKNVKNQKGDNISIDQAYENIENLYNDIKLEFSLNIKQIDEEEIKTFNNLIKINESFEDDFSQKLSDDFKPLKKGILKLIDATLEGDKTKLQDFLDSYTKSDSEDILDGFVEDAELFEFYLKYQTNIDEILDNMGYYDDPPEVKSLYDYVINGTFDAVIYAMKEIKKELYEKT